MPTLILLAACGLNTTIQGAGLDDDSSSTVVLGSLAISPGALDFGYVPVGNVAEDSVVIQNVGDDVVTIQDIEVKGDEAFTLTSTKLAPTELASQEDLVVTVQFAPELLDDYAGALALTTDAPGEEYVEVELTGTSLSAGTGTTGSGTGGGTGAEISVDPLSIDFGTVDIGQGETGSADVTIRNDGDEDMLLLSMSFSDGAFGWEPGFNLPYVLAAGAVKIVPFTFRPTAEGTYSGTATLETDDPDNLTVTIDLYGEAIQTCSVCQPMISVSPACVETHWLYGGSNPATVTVTNIGDLPLTVSDMTITNGAALSKPDGNFVLTSGWNGSPVTLDPFQTLSVQVEYQGGGALSIEYGDCTLFNTNTLTITSDDRGLPGSQTCVPLNYLGLCM